MSDKQQLDQRIATLQEWLAEYKLDEIKGIPTVRPPVRPPAAPRPAEIPRTTKPGAAGAEELVLGPGGTYYPKGQVPSEADLLARQAEVDKLAKAQAKRAETGKTTTTAADLPPGIIHGEGPVYPSAYVPAKRPQTPSKMMGPDGKPIMRDMTDAEIRAQKQAAIDTAKAQAGGGGAGGGGAGGGGAGGGGAKEPFFGWKWGLGAGAGLGGALGYGLDQAFDISSKLRTAFPELGRQADQVGGWLDPTLPPEQFLQNLRLDQQKQGQTPPPPKVPDAIIPTTPPPRTNSFGTEEPSRPNESFDRLRELAGIAKKSN